jgi:DNA-binding transcriptional regulator YbjK
VHAAIEPDRDGRRARGTASREAIVNAAVRIVVSRGLAAVTHRAVAEEAAVSLARTTYHFPTVEALLRAVQRHFTDGFDARLLEMISAARGRHASIVDVCCDFLAELVGTRRGELLATLELGVAAARRPEVRSTGERSGDGVIPIIMTFGADEDRARTIFAAFYGFAVLGAMRSDRTSSAEIRDFVTAIIQPDHM